MENLHETAHISKEDKAHSFIRLVYFLKAWNILPKASQHGTMQQFTQVE